MIPIQFSCLKILAHVGHEILLESLANMSYVPWFITNKIHMITYIDGIIGIHGKLLIGIRLCQ